MTEDNKGSATQPSRTRKITLWALACWFVAAVVSIGLEVCGRVP